MCTPSHVEQVILSGGSSHTPKIANVVQTLFPQSTTVLAPSTSPAAINPSELTARGAAIQASLIEEFDQDDIDQSTHPAVTATPHLRNAIGVLVLSESEEKGIFKPLLEAETAIPARRTSQFATPREGGDVIVKICEGIRNIKITKPETKPKANGKTGEDDEDEDSEADDEEEEEVREKTWKVGTVLAEAAVKNIKKGGKVEVMVNVGSDLGVQITAREVGAKGGVRGTLATVEVVENGSA